MQTIKSSLWNEILRTALLGTDRAKLSPQLQKELEQLGVDPALEEAEALLEATILVSRMRRAGRILSRWTQPLPKLEEQEEEQVCPSDFVQLLGKILEGEDDRLLRQTMQQMQAHRMVLPGSILPSLLQQATSDKALAELLVPVLGNRGKWLAGLNPEWQPLVASAESLSWETGKYQERLALLRYWRREDPAVGLHLLESTWKEETTAHQKAFLKLLEIHLSLADEDFLEKQLDSRRKAIRQTAAELLGKIADAALVKRMFERGKALLELKGKSDRKKLKVELPETIDEALLRDGLDAKKQWSQGGLKASRLWQILSVVPPRYWTDHFDCSASELLDIYARSEWSTLLVQSAIDATLRHGDETWTELLIDFWLANYSKQRWANLEIEKLYDQLKSSSYERLVLKALRKNTEVPEEEDPLVDLLSVSHLPWSAKLTEKILTALRLWMASDEMRYWGGWYLKQVLVNAAYCADPSLCDRVQRAWNNAGPVWGSWESDVDDFFVVYQKRKRIVELLGK